MTLVATSFHVSGQQLGAKQTYTSEQFTMKVKLIEEFIDRFNNKIKIFKDQDLHQFELNNEERYAMLKQLFNHGEQWNIPEVKEFIDYINRPDSTVTITFYDDQWFAELNCDVKYKNKPERVSLIMQIEILPDYSSKWIVKGVKADFLDFQAVNSGVNPINPTSHNMRFINLPRHFVMKENYRNYFPQDFQPSTLSIFFSELRNSNLVFGDVSKIRYYFFNVRDWLFTVDYFETGVNQSGWLISSLLKMQEPDKKVYQTQYLRIED
jgi:hypothetical protein